MRSDNLYELPADIPVPVDDGACDHLLGCLIPPIELPSTSGQSVDLSKQSSPIVVIYCYPRTGTPNCDPPPGWNNIPGARGCTPESISFRDYYKQFKDYGAEIFGLSTQSVEYQQEMVTRLELPFEVLSDAGLLFTNVLNLPTFEVASNILLKRLTLIILNQKIIKVFYPVFPPNTHAQEVLMWLSCSIAQLDFSH